MGLYGERAPDCDIAISHGRLKLDSQDRYARQKTPFWGQFSDNGADEGEVSGSCRVSDLLEHDYIAPFTRMTGVVLVVGAIHFMHFHLLVGTVCHVFWKKLSHGVRY